MLKPERSTGSIRCFFCPFVILLSVIPLQLCDLHVTVARINVKTGGCGRVEIKIIGYCRDVFFI